MGILNSILSVFTYGLFNHDASSLCYMYCRDGMTVNNEFVRMWKEVVLAHEAYE